ADVATGRRIVDEAGHGQGEAVRSRAAEVAVGGRPAVDGDGRPFSDVAESVLEDYVQHLAGRAEGHAGRLDAAAQDAGPGRVELDEPAVREDHHQHLA